MQHPRLLLMYKEMKAQHSSTVAPGTKSEIDRVTKILDAMLDCELCPMINSILGHCGSNVYQPIYLWCKEIIITYYCKLNQLLSQINVGQPSKERSQMLHVINRMASALGSVLSIVDTARERIDDSFPITQHLNEEDGKV